MKWDYVIHVSNPIKDNDKPHRDIRVWHEVLAVCPLLYHYVTTFLGSTHRTKLS